MTFDPHNGSTVTEILYPPGKVLKSLGQEILLIDCFDYKGTNKFYNSLVEKDFKALQELEYICLDIQGRWWLTEKGLTLRELLKL